MQNLNQQNKPKKENRISDIYEGLKEGFKSLGLSNKNHKKALEDALKIISRKGEKSIYKKIYDDTYNSLIAESKTTDYAHKAAIEAVLKELKINKLISSGVIRKEAEDILKLGLNLNKDMYLMARNMDNKSHEDALSEANIVNLNIKKNKVNFEEKGAKKVENSEIQNLIDLDSSTQEILKKFTIEETPEQNEDKATTKSGISKDIKYMKEIDINLTPAAALDRGAPVTSVSGSAAPVPDTAQPQQVLNVADPVVPPQPEQAVPDEQAQDDAGIVQPQQVLNVADPVVPPQPEQAVPDEQAQDDAGIVQPQQVLNGANPVVPPQPEQEVPDEQAQDDAGIVQPQQVLNGANPVVPPQPEQEVPDEQAQDDEADADEQVQDDADDSDSDYYEADDDDEYDDESESDDDAEIVQHQQVLNVADPVVPPQPEQAQDDAGIVQHQQVLNGANPVVPPQPEQEVPDEQAQDDEADADEQVQDDADDSDSDYYEADDDDEYDDESESDDDAEIVQHQQVLNVADPVVPPQPEQAQDDAGIVQHQQVLNGANPVVPPQPEQEVPDEQAQDDEADDDDEYDDESESDDDAEIVQHQQVLNGANPVVPPQPEQEVPDEQAQDDEADDDDEYDDESESDDDAEIVQPQQVLNVADPVVLPQPEQAQDDADDSDSDSDSNFYYDSEGNFYYNCSNVNYSKFDYYYESDYDAEIVQPQKVLNGANTVVQPQPEQAQDDAGIVQHQQVQDDADDSDSDYYNSYYESESDSDSESESDDDDARIAPADHVPGADEQVRADDGNVPNIFNVTLNWVSNVGNVATHYDERGVPIVPASEFSTNNSCYNDDTVDCIGNNNCNHQNNGSCSWDSENNMVIVD